MTSEINPNDARLVYRIDLWGKLLTGTLVLTLAVLFYFDPPWSGARYEPIVEEQPAHEFSTRTVTKPITATVVRVHDGDTIVVKVEGWPEVLSPISVRVFGIDCPEIHDKRPELATLALAARLETSQCCPIGSDVRLLNVKRDKYFRLLATVIFKTGDGYFQEESLSVHLKDLNLAKPYDGQGKKPW